MSYKVDRALYSKSTAILEALSLARRQRWSYGVKKPRAVFKKKKKVIVGSGVLKTKKR